MKWLKHVLIAAAIFFSNTAHSTTITATYQYDDLDRLEKAEFAGDGYSASFTYTYDDSGNILNVWIESSASGFTDSDKDGIDDEWERSYFGNLTTINATSDYDGDGYQDSWEYLNSQEGILDPAGYGFDPTVANAPGGRGYQQGVNASFWTLMIPVIMSTIEGQSR